MTKNFLRVTAVAVLLIAPFSASPTHSFAAPETQCDRACLQNIAGQYLAAMLKHDPSGLPLAPGYKYTENTAAIPLGDGLWVGASELPTTFKIYAVDPASKQIALFAVMKEFDRPVIFALRLKVEDGKITEIEHIVVRTIRDIVMPNLVAPRPGLVETIPQSARESRDKMFNAADSYFDALQQSNGNLAPFADDCVRHENGMQTTGNTSPNQPDTSGAPMSPKRLKLRALGCRDGINSHLFTYISKIQPRRILVIDEEKGLVFSFPMFVHRGNVRTIKIVGVPGVDTIPMDFGPIDLQAAEIFAIRDGKIHEIEAMGYLLPFNSKTGWE
jgi:hypothetical protein